MNEKKISNYLLIIFTLSSFLLRLIPWKNTIVQGGKWVIFVQPDAYYHLRRAAIWAQNFPKIITIDYYMSYPFGAECPWPPLYDWLIAVISLMLGLGRYNVQILQLLTALFPPILAALCVIPLYKVVKLLWNNERIALMASFFAILMPGMLGYSTVASGDHHIAETLIGLWFYYYGLLVVNNTINGNYNIKNIVMAGIFIAVGLLVWQGEVVFYSIWAMYIFFLILLNRGNNNLIEAITRNNLYSAIIGSTIVAFVRFIIPRGTELSLFDFGYFSYFQPLYIFSIFLALYLFGKLLILYKENKKLFVSMLLIFSFAILILFVGIKPLRIGLWNGINFLFKTDPWHSSINEFQSTFSWEILKNLDSLPAIINFLYFLSFLLPFFYGCLYLYRWIRWNFISGTYELKVVRIYSKPTIGSKITFIGGNGLKFKKYIESFKIKTLFFIVVGISFFLLALYQKRWTNSYSPILAIGISLFINSIYKRIKSGHLFIKEFLHWRSRTKGIKAGIITRFIFYWEKSPILLSIFVILFVLAPYYIIASEVLLRKGYPIESDVYNSLQWMRMRTPKTSHLYKPNERPEYGVLSQWDLGHYIQYVAERPTIVNNFGHQLPGDGFKTAIYVWSAETEEELKAILDKYKVRYLILTDPVIYMNNNTRAYLKEGYIEKAIDFVPAHFGALIPTPTDEFFRYPLSNAWVFDGSSNGYRSASKILRLVFESQNPSIVQYFDEREIKKIKIFEYVKGAKIKGKAKPRDIVYIRAEFITNFDRRFEWEAAAIADEQGNFEGDLPYATAEDNLFVKPLSPYQLFTQDRISKIFTTNNDVEQGKEIDVDLTKGENIPDVMKKEISIKLSSLAGSIKSKGYVNIHRKIDGK